MAVSHISPSFFFLDALRRYSEDFQLRERTNPIEFVLNGQPYSVHVSETHFAARLNPDEWRIQIPRQVIDTQRARLAAGTKVAFVGFFPDGTVFTGWEPAYVLSLQPVDVGSVYVSRTHWEIVPRENCAVEERRAQNLGRATQKISMGTDLLGLYLENLAVFHAVSSEADLKQIVDGIGPSVATDSLNGEVEAEILIAGQRKVVTSTRTAFQRDPRFREAVMRAYEGACCICGRQLGLVEAAHIVPHGQVDSNDHVTNGLALCVEHHRLYDGVLLIPEPGRRLFLNPDRVEHLRNIGQDTGLDAIEQLASQLYRIPDHAPSRPSDDFLTRGKAIRLG